MYLVADCNNVMHGNVAGSYSLGGGERFEDFAHFPSGFIAENVADGGDLLSGATATKPSEEKTCKIG